MTLLTFAQMKEGIKTSNFFCILVVVTSWRSQAPQLAPRHIVQDCIGGESMATCVNLTDSDFEPSLPLQKARRSTTGPFGWENTTANQEIIDSGNLVPDNGNCANQC